MKKNITPNTVQVVEDEDGSACKTIKVKVTDVDWDVEEQDLIDSMKGDPNDPSQVKMEIDTVKLNLNKRLESDPYVEVEYCPGDDLDELVGDAISEKFGWLVNGFNFEPVEDGEDTGETGQEVEIVKEEDDDTDWDSAFKWACSHRSYECREIEKLFAGFGNTWSLDYTKVYIWPMWRVMPCVCIDLDGKCYKLLRKYNSIEVFCDKTETDISEFSKLLRKAGLTPLGKRDFRVLYGLLDEIDLAMQHYADEEYANKSGPVTEEFDTEDGWDCDEIRDSGLMDTLRKCANLHYTLDKCTRASANFGDTLADLKAYVNELAEEMQNAVADFPDGEMLEEDDEEAAPSGPPYFEEACEVDELIAMYFSDLAYVSKMKWTQFLDNLEQRPGDEYLTDFCEWAWGDGVKMSQEDMDFVKERLNEFFDDGELEDTWKKSSPAEKEGVEEAIPRTLKDIDATKAKNIIAKALKAGTGEWEGQPELSDFVYQTASGKYMLLRKSWGDHWETGRVSL